MELPADRGAEPDCCGYDARGSGRQAPGYRRLQRLRGSGVGGWTGGRLCAVDDEWKPDQIPRTTHEVREYGRYGNLDRELHRAALCRRWDHRVDRRFSNETHEPIERAICTQRAFRESALISLMVEKSEETMKNFRRFVFSGVAL